MSAKPIQFTPTSEAQQAEITAHALAKGFKNASAFALYAVVQTMARYPLSEAQKARVEGKHEEGETGR